MKDTRWEINFIVIAGSEKTLFGASAGAVRGFCQDFSGNFLQFYVKWVLQMKFSAWNSLELSFKFEKRKDFKAYLNLNRFTAKKIVTSLAKRLFSFSVPIYANFWSFFGLRNVAVEVSIENLQWKAKF